MRRRPRIAAPALRPSIFTVSLLALVLLTPSAHAGGSVTSGRAAMSSASPLATRVGLDTLRRGGNAADAAVAVALVLAVVRPQAGNLGGGGFALYYDAKSTGVWSLDFRETAPRDVKPESFSGSPVASRTGPLAAGVPGTVAGLDALHRRFGKLHWSDVVAPSESIARAGFQADSETKMALAAAKRERSIDQFPATEALFFADNTPRETIAPEELARTLGRIAQRGAREFYTGDTAKILVERVRAAGGIIGFRDLADYQPVWRAPMRIRSAEYDLYTVPPPSGGGLVIAQALGILANDDLRTLGFQSPAALHLLVEAQRRAFIDRNAYAADPLSARIPYRDLLSSDRARQWRRTIDPDRVIATSGLSGPAAIAPEGEHTTHFTIVDPEGNIVALTTTLGEDFGGGFVVPGLGFLLNNAMDDFTTSPGRANRDGLVQGRVNLVDATKRPASSLAPAFVFRNGKPFLALGTAGGPAIPTTVLQIFLNVTAYGKSLAEAIAAPRYHHQAIPEEMAFETGRAPKETIDALNAMGHAVLGRAAIGDVHAVMIDKGRLTAVADPRHGGAAGGF